MLGKYQPGQVWPSSAGSVKLALPSCRNVWRGIFDPRKEPLWQVERSPDQHRIVALGQARDTLARVIRDGCAGIFGPVRLVD